MTEAYFLHAGCSSPHFTFRALHGLGFSLFSTRLFARLQRHSGPIENHSLSR